MDFLDLLMLLARIGERLLWLFERIGNAVILFVIGVVCLGIAIYGFFTGWSLGPVIGFLVLEALAFWAAYREWRLEHPAVISDRRKG